MSVGTRMGEGWMGYLQNRGAQLGLFRFLGVRI